MNVVFRRTVSRFVLVLALGLSGCRYRAPETVVVAALLPLTGVHAAQGEYARNGITLAVNEINAAGGVDGKLLRVVVEDSQSTAEGGVAAYQKLTGADRIGATLATLNSVVVPVSSLAGRVNSVLLNCGAQDASLRKAGPYVFSLVPDAIEEARAMAEFSINRLHLKTAGTLTFERHSGAAAAAMFAAEFVRLGGRIVAEAAVEWNFPLVRLGDDVQKPIAKLRLASPEAIFVSGPAATLPKVFRTGAELGMKWQWLTESSFELDGALAAAGEAGQGVVYTARRPLDVDAGPAGRFAAAYKARFGIDADATAATFYDGVYALTSAIHAGGGTGAAAIADGLRKASFDGVTGRIDFRNGPFVHRSMEFRTAHAGRPHVVPER